MQLIWKKLKFIRWRRSRNCFWGEWISVYIFILPCKLWVGALDLWKSIKNKTERRRRTDSFLGLTGLEKEQDLPRASEEHSWSSRCLRGTRKQQQMCDSILLIWLLTLTIFLFPVPSCFALPYDCLERAWWMIKLRWHNFFKIRE